MVKKEITSCLVRIRFQKDAFQITLKAEIEVEKIRGIICQNPLFAKIKYGWEKEEGQINAKALRQQSKEHSQGLLVVKSGC